MRPISTCIKDAPTAKLVKKQVIRSQCRGLALISQISQTFLEAALFGTLPPGAEIEHLIAKD